MNFNNENVIKNDVIKIAYIVFIFIFSVNLLNKENYIIIILFFSILLYCFKNNIEIKLNYEFLILILFSTSYFFIYDIYFFVSLQSLITFWLGPIIGYFIGYVIINKKNIVSKDVILILTLGLFTHGFLNSCKYLYLGLQGQRLIPDVWLNTGISATLQSTFFSMIISLIFFYLFISHNKIKKIIIIISCIFVIFLTIEMASRTLIYIASIVFFLNLLLYIYLNKKKKQKIYKMIIVIISSILLSSFLYNINLFNFKVWYNTSPLNMRIEENKIKTINDPRLEAQKQVLKEMINYPMGGDKIKLVECYAHNLWLDTIKKTGLIPGFFLIIYFIFTIISMIKLLSNVLINDEDKYIIFSIYTGLFINFMTEPILEGVPYMFVIMCIINGLTKKMLDIKKYEKVNKNENNLVM